MLPSAPIGKLGTAGHVTEAELSTSIISDPRVVNPFCNNPAVTKILKLPAERKSKFW